MRRILKPVCLLAISVLVIGAMSDSASAGGRRRCSCAVPVANFAGPVQPNTVVQTGNRVQYQSAYQAPAINAPVAAPAYYYVPQYQSSYGNDYSRRSGWGYGSWDAGRKIRGL